MTREQQAARAQKLQQALGEDYTVRFDDCESCMTRFLYKGVHYKEIENSELENPFLNVIDYVAPMQMVMALRYQ